LPNIKSSIKRVNITRSKTANNLTQKSALKTLIKKCRETIANDPENAAAILNKTLKTVDQAAADGLIKKNTGARRKSSLVKSYNASLKACSEKASSETETALKASAGSENKPEKAAVKTSASKKATAAKTSTAAKASTSTAPVKETEKKPKAAKSVKADKPAEKSETAAETKIEAATPVAEAAKADTISEEKAEITAEPAAKAKTPEKPAEAEAPAETAANPVAEADEKADEKA